MTGRVNRRALVLSLLLAVLAAVLVARERGLATVYALRLGSGHVVLMEDPASRALLRFRRQERLDEVVAGREDDMGRLRALAEWASGLFESSTPFPNYPPWDGAETLAMIRGGRTGGFCAQYAVVFAEACQSLGYAVRFVDLLSEEKERAHFVPEVYVGSLGRWVVFEPQWGTWYTDAAGAPLGVLEINDRQAGRVEGPVLGAPAGVPLEPPELALFHYFRVFLRSNFLTVPVHYRINTLDEGRQWVFEPYYLSWAGLPGMEGPDGPLESSRREDFTYRVDWREAETVRAGDARRFMEILGRAGEGKLFKVRIPPAALTEVVERYLVGDPSYRPLTGR